MNPLQSILIALLARADFLAQFLSAELRAEKGGSPALTLVPAAGQTLLIRAEGETFTLRRGKGEPVVYTRAELFGAIGVGGGE